MGIPIYVCWHDYNGHYVTKFTNIEAAERKVQTVLHEKEVEDDYGTKIDLIVKGLEYEIKIIKRIAEVKLVQKE